MSEPVAIKLLQGGTFAQLLRIKQPGGAARDLTGLKVRAQIRQKMSSGEAVATFDSDDGTVTINAAAGEMTFHLTSVETRDLPTQNIQQRWVFDFEIYNDGVSPEHVERHPEWTLPVIVYPNVTR